MPCDDMVACVVSGSNKLLPRSRFRRSAQRALPNPVLKFARRLPLRRTSLTVLMPKFVHFAAPATGRGEALLVLIEPSAYVKFLFTSRQREMGQG